MHFGQFKDAVDPTVYPDVEQYWDDLIAVFQPGNHGAIRRRVPLSAA
jgi:hypothetical protein